MEDCIIKVENVSMKFNLSKEKIDSLKEYLIKLVQGKLMYEEFWALNNINFEAKRGDRIGIIGLNGSGKSTLLKVIAGVMKPTIGKVEVKGTIAPLIELGAGFDLDLSAKENVYLNGAILGLPDKLLQDKYDEIIEFAGLKKFEDVAIKNFSSGMVARLGFAIATCNVPDILIVDEILSVGDYEFQKKCYEKMRYITSLGTTILFVSHSPEQILDLCNKAIWLQNGSMIDKDTPDIIIKKYIG